MSPAWAGLLALVLALVLALLSTMILAASPSIGSPPADFGSGSGSAVTVRAMTDCSGSVPSLFWRWDCLGTRCRGSQRLWQRETLFQAAPSATHVRTTPRARSASASPVGVAAGCDGNDASNPSSRCGQIVLPDDSLFQYCGHRCA